MVSLSEAPAERASTNRWRWADRPATIGQVPALHDDELEIDSELVRRLVAHALPRYAGLSVEPLPSSGSSNALFRLGESLLARLPRQRGGSATLEKEARWLPVVAPGLSVAVPEILATGDPAFGYPERWAVTTWLGGRSPAVPWDAHDGSPDDLARALARFVSEVRRVQVPPAAYDDPALSSYRGGRLADVDDDLRQAVEQSRAIAGLDLDLDRVLGLWAEAVAAERDRAPRTTWLHGDLLAENLLTRDGELAAVLDFGGLAVGDPAVDLVVAWEVLDRRGRASFRSAARIDDGEWATGRGWALLIAMITFPYYWHTMPARCAARRSMAAAVLAEG